LSRDSNAIVAEFFSSLSTDPLPVNDRQSDLHLRERTAIGRSMGSQLEDEIESWKGFPWALRKEDRELWDEMIKEVRQCYAGAVEQSGKLLTTDPFFMALILAQQRTIERLRAQLRETERPGLVDNWSTK